MTQKAHSRTCQPPNKQPWSATAKSGTSPVGSPSMFLRSPEMALRESGTLGASATPVASHNGQLSVYRGPQWSDSPGPFANLEVLPSPNPGQPGVASYVTRPGLCLSAEEGSRSKLSFDSFLIISFTTLMFCQCAWITDMHCKKPAWAFNGMRM